GRSGPHPPGRPFVSTPEALECPAYVCSFPVGQPGHPTGVKSMSSCRRRSPFDPEVKRDHGAHMPTLMTVATRVLRLRLVPESAPTTSLDDSPAIEFVAYGHETLLAGWIQLDADRLTDLLNASDELELVDVVCLGPDGRIVDVDRAVIP